MNDGRQPGAQQRLKSALYGCLFGVISLLLFFTLTQSGALPLTLSTAGKTVILLAMGGLVVTMLIIVGRLSRTNR